MSRAARIASIAGKYGAAASIGIKNRLAYAGNFLGSLLTYGLFIFVFSRIWATIYQGRGSIAGYDRAMCVWYFIVAELSAFGFGRFFGGLAQDVKSGQVAYLLARPYSFVGYHYAERLGVAAFETALLLLVGAGLGLAFAGAPPIGSAGQAALVLLSLALAASLQFFLQFALSMTAFWIEENSAFFWIYQKLSLVVGTLVPIEFLPEGAQRVAWYTPFPLVSYAPARIAVAFEPGRALELVALQAAWVAGAALLCRLAFALGAAKLESQGG